MNFKMALVHSHTNTHMAMNNELVELNARLSAIKTEKMYIEAEIENRKVNPKLYPIGSGAGTIEDLVEQIDGFDQEIENVGEERDQLLFVIADKIGLENLQAERRRVGKEMSKYNRLQHEAYELQKERYENCKNTFGFKPADREFIAHYRGLNETYKNIWDKLCDQREELCELIDALDPNDEDLGFDEDEE